MTEEFNIWQALQRASFVLAVFSSLRRPTIQVLKGYSLTTVATVEEALGLIKAAAEQRPHRTGVPSVPPKQLIHEASFLLAITRTRIDILKDRYNPDGVRWIGATYATVEVRLKRAWQQTLVDAVLASEEETG